MNPGDRQSSYQGIMRPIGVELKCKEHSILHRCVKCGHERKNKMSEEDNFDAVIQLSVHPVNR